MKRRTNCTVLRNCNRKTIFFNLALRACSHLFLRAIDSLLLCRMAFLSTKHAWNHLCLSTSSAVKRDLTFRVSNPRINPCALFEISLQYAGGNLKSGLSMLRKYCRRVGLSSKGGTPERSSYIMTPMLHMSQLAPYLTRPLEEGITTSGATYRGVPRDEDVYPCFSIFFANPKSKTFKDSILGSSDIGFSNIMFCGLRSR
mmetsp:Transcript_13627/g.20500  ORF Transcript_13627/g.20500 Transcript_13627/m.20500 type:complete len:200 (-) Transcript_13627:533-1132(-)